MAGSPFHSPSTDGQHAPARDGVGEWAHALGGLQDNWDGHLARAPSSEFIERATALLDGLPPDKPPPEVFPSTDGGVILEWNQPGAEIVVIIGPTGIEVSIERNDEIIEGSLESLESAFVSTLGQTDSL